MSVAPLIRQAPFRWTRPFQLSTDGRGSGRLAPSAGVLGCRKLLIPPYVGSDPVLAPGQSSLCPDHDDALAGHRHVPSAVWRWMLRRLWWWPPVPKLRPRFGPGSVAATALSFHERRQGTCARAGAGGDVRTPAAPASQVTGFRQLSGASPRCGPALDRPHGRTSCAPVMPQPAFPPPAIPTPSSPLTSPRWCAPNSACTPPKVAACR